MNESDLKAFAEDQRKKVEEVAQDIQKMSPSQRQARLQALIEQHKPLHEARVKLAMELMMISMEVRLDILKSSFPGIKVETINELCELPPSDHVIGDTEKWVEKIKGNGLSPKKIQVDRTRMVIRILE